MCQCGKEVKGDELRESLLHECAPLPNEFESSGARLWDHREKPAV